MLTGLRNTCLRPMDKKNDGVTLVGSNTEIWREGEGVRKREREMRNLMRTERVGEGGTRMMMTVVMVMVMVMAVARKPRAVAVVSGSGSSSKGAERGEASWQAGRMGWARLGSSRQAGQAVESSRVDFGGPEQSGSAAGS